MAYKQKGSPFQRNFGVGKSPAKFTGEYLDMVDAATGRIIKSKRQKDNIKKAREATKLDAKHFDTGAYSGDAYMRNLELDEDHPSKIHALDKSLRQEHEVPYITESGTEIYPVRRLTGWDKRMAMLGQHPEGSFEAEESKRAADKYWEQYKKDNPKTWEADKELYEQREAKGRGSRYYPTNISKAKLQQLERDESKKGEFIQDQPAGQYYGKELEGAMDRGVDVEGLGGGLKPLSPRELREFQKEQKRRLGMDAKK